MPLNICEINLFLTWFVNCLIVAGTANNQEATFAITKTKCSSCNFINSRSCKLLQQLKTSFERTINWNTDIKPISKLLNQCKFSGSSK